MRTLYDQKDSIVTEEDRVTEEEHINSALKICGYPDWALKRVKYQISHKKDQGGSKTKKQSAKGNQDMPQHRTLVVLPYVRGTTEVVQRVLKQNNVTTAVRPNTTLRKLLVSPKDKIPKDK